MKRRVMIIGLDGGSWDVMRPMMEKGLMPNLKGLTERGAVGDLQSTVPPITPVAWTSFMTGVNPGKHGIFGFSQYDFQERKVVFNDARRFKAATFWEIASESRTVVCLNVPMTYPPKAVNGCMVSGLMTPSPDVEFAYPAELKAELTQKVGFELPIADHRYAPLTDFDTTLAWLNDTVDNALRATQYLDKKYPWQILMSQFQATDYLQHPFWGYFHPEHPDYDAEKAQHIEQFYARVDNAIGALQGLLEPQDVLIVMSDHGFRENRRVFNLTAWLRHEGYLVLSKQEGHNKKIDSGLDVLRKVDKHGVLRGALRSSLAAKVRPALGKARMYFDAEETRAYADVTKIYGMVHFPPAVEAAQKKQLADEIIEKLMAFKDPETGKQVIEEVFRKEDIYQPSNIEGTPDLVIAPCVNYSIAASARADEPPVTPIRSGKDLHVGTHAMDGILVLHGEGVQPSQNLQASIVDLAPTILALSEVPIPEHMDGRVITEAFKENLQLSHRSDADGSNRNGKSGYTSEEEESITDMLANLGYVD